MKFKLGQQIVFKKDHVILAANKGSIVVKKGDKATVVKKIDEHSGEIIYSSGAAKGLSRVVPMEVDTTLDEDAIVKKILSDLSE